MPGSNLPRMPIPTPIPMPTFPGIRTPMPILPGPLPMHFEYLPNFHTIIPGVPLQGGVNARGIASPRSQVLPVATAAPKASAARFEATLRVLRDTFGLDEEGEVKTGAKPEATAGAFDGNAVAKPVAVNNGRPVQSIPEQELERDLGVK